MNDIMKGLLEAAELNGYTKGIIDFVESLNDEDINNKAYDFIKNKGITVEELKRESDLDLQMFVKTLLKQQVVDKSAVRRIAAQMGVDVSE